jgi:hypothetical protein
VADYISDRIEIAPKQTLKRKIVTAISKKLHPVNTIRYAGKDLYVYHPRQVIELFIFNILSNNPWVMGANTNLDIIALGSEIQASENRTHGVPKNKIRVTGFLPHDKLHRRAQIYKKLGANNKKIFLIIGTHYFSALVEPPEYYSLDNEVNDMLEVLISTLGSEYEFIFKIHPQRLIREQKAAIKKSLRNRITFVKSRHSVYELLTISDATLNFMSSAVIASFATDGPIFAYYLFRKISTTQDWHKKFKSIIQVSSPAELKTALLDMKVNKELRQIDRDKYGKFDGQNTKRFMKLIEYLSS